MNEFEYQQFAVISKPFMFANKRETTNEHVILSSATSRMTHTVHEHTAVSQERRWGPRGALTFKGRHGLQDAKLLEHCHEKDDDNTNGKQFHALDLHDSDNALGQARNTKAWPRGEDPKRRGRLGGP